jgi:GNAT superfamily N-acetyltransferase
MITLLPFQPSDQPEARALILSGLVEHWGFLDASKNPDLEDIAFSYAGGFFLVARQEGRLVGTGALLPTADPATWQVVRMSVARELRRSGLGRQILSRLEQEAYQRGARRLILETTAAWQEVISFYLRCGYQILEDQGETRTTEDVYFEKWL